MMTVAMTEALLYGEILILCVIGILRMGGRGGTMTRQRSLSCCSVGGNRNCCMKPTHRR